MKLTKKVKQISSEKEALELSIELWSWLVENFPKMKEDHPKFVDIYYWVESFCPMCEYHNICEECCLLGFCDTCEVQPGIYWIWAEYVYGQVAFDKSKEIEALEAAEKILETLENRLEEFEDA